MQGVVGGVRSLPRAVLSKVLGDDHRVVRAFEEDSTQVATTAAQAGAAVQATGAIQEATVLTLSPNEAFTNERVVVFGDGLAGDDDGSHLTIRTNDDTAHVQGGFPVYFTAENPTTLLLPAQGTLVTRENAETLRKKTLDAPKLSGLGNYADDSAASAGGVPVGGVYHNAGALRVRLA